jgi:flavin reductase (DIM6/NTAB) family NADH-FMN oxidoreductase RutF
MIDARQFRNVLGCFATGVAVIAVDFESGVHAMTANAVSALSLDPMLVLFCPSKRARLGDILPHVERFTINFLRDEQQALSTYFAGGWKEPNPPPFRFVANDGAPRLEGSLASLVCTKRDVLDSGDHWLVTGQVIALHQGIEPHHPLVFFKGKYQTMERNIGKEAPALVDVTDEPAIVYYTA